jgi:hypothetical protein
MANLFKWEVAELKCDICKERPMVDTIRVSPGVWLGVCKECMPDNKEAVK